MDVQSSLSQGKVSFRRAEETLIIGLSGPWHLAKDVPSASLLAQELSASSAPRRLSFDAAQLTHWDSGLISFLTQTAELCRARGITEDREGLPNGLRRLVELAEAVPEKKGARSAAKKTPFLARVGEATISYGLAVSEFLEFIGVLTIAFGKFFRGKARYRKIDLMEAIQQCGASAAGIVMLITFLVGVILAFMGAVQLRNSARRFTWRTWSVSHECARWAR